PPVDARAVPRARGRQLQLPRGVVPPGPPGGVRDPGPGVAQGLPPRSRPAVALRRDVRRRRRPAELRARAGSGNPPRPPPRVPVAEPVLGEEELANVVAAMRSGWISSLGAFIAEFERDFAEY